MRMPFLNSVYTQVDFDRKLVFKFFTLFSLFEYALKKTQFKRIRNGILEATWDDFAIQISPHFHPRQGSKLQVTVNYLLTIPPKKQILDVHNRPIFEPNVVRPANVTNDTVWLSILIRRVRNNLFHGGKFTFDRPRDPDLISSLLLVLESWSQLHPDVKQALRNAQ
jgi:hypothetical protein